MQVSISRKGKQHVCVLWCNSYSFACIFMMCVCAYSAATYANVCWCRVDKVYTCASVCWCSFGLETLEEITCWRLGMWTFLPRREAKHALAHSWQWLCICMANDWAGEQAIVTQYVMSVCLFQVEILTKGCVCEIIGQDGLRRAHLMQARVIHSVPIWHKALRNKERLIAYAVLYLHPSNALYVEYLVS